MAAPRTCDTVSGCAQRFFLDRDGRERLAEQPTEPLRILDTSFLPFAPSGNCGVRRHVFEALGGFDTSYRVCEDDDFFWRLQLAGHELAGVPSPSCSSATACGLALGEAGLRSRSVPGSSVQAIRFARTLAPIDPEDAHRRCRHARSDADTAAQPLRSSALLGPARADRWPPVRQRRRASPLLLGAVRE